MLFQETEKVTKMSGHPLYLLVFVTFLLFLGFLVWSKISTKRSQQGKQSGIGGPNDPIS